MKKYSLLIIISSILILTLLLSVVIYTVSKIKNYEQEINRLKIETETLKKKIEKILQGKIEVLATAYTSSRKECDDTPFITASNKKVRWGIVAMDKVPFGTKVYIPYFKKTFVVEDRGGAIKGNRIDIWMSNRKDALKFGRKKLIVYVLGR
jgi:3D (Asp-Asp-Asp) domain-containing protein